MVPRAVGESVTQPTPPSKSRAPKGRAQQSKWEHNGSYAQRQHPVDRDPQNAKWQQEQPYERICNQRQERHWPAQHKQHAPQKERDHMNAPNSTIRISRLPGSARMNISASELRLRFSI